MPVNGRWPENDGSVVTSKLSLLPTLAHLNHVLVDYSPYGSSRRNCKLTGTRIGVIYYGPIGW